MTVAVLAVQGAFIEHEHMMDKLGVSTIELRKKEDLHKSFDALILPGGESTVQGKLLKELDMFDALKEKIENAMPVLATCAGMILLAQRLSNDDKQWFATLPVTVKRNAYGRQLGSFSTVADVGDVKAFPLEFIRAPYVEKADQDVEVLSVVEERIVAVKYKNQLALAFHPELGDDMRIHQQFLKMIEETKS